jgi:hypothetical protein
MNSEIEHDRHWSATVNGTATLVLALAALCGMAAGVSLVF